GGRRARRFAGASSSSAPTGSSAVTPSSSLGRCSVSRASRIGWCGSTRSRAARVTSRSPAAWPRRSRSSTCSCPATTWRAWRRSRPRSRSPRRSVPRPLPFWLGLFDEHVVERALRLLTRGQQIVDVRLAKVASGRQQVLERAPRVAPQPDAKRREHRRLPLRQALRHLDLGERLLRATQELLVLAQSFAK